MPQRPKHAVTLKSVQYRYAHARWLCREMSTRGSAEPNGTPAAACHGMLGAAKGGVR